MFSINISGFNQIANKLSGVPVVVNVMMHQMMEQLAQNTQAVVKQTAPHNTGALADSINYKIEDQYKQVTATIGTPNPYSKFQEEGTGVYGPTGSPVVPRTARVLAWQSGGITIFARSVRGVQGKHYFQAGLQAAKERIRETMLVGFLIMHQKLGF